MHEIAGYAALALVLGVADHFSRGRLAARIATLEQKDVRVTIEIERTR